VGGVGVLASVAAGAALAEEVPALVELDLDLVEAGLLIVVEALAERLAFQGVLLLDQVADPVKHLLVVHLGSSDPGGMRAATVMMPWGVPLLHLLMGGPGAAA
jgi:hypothetical protein